MKITSGLHEYETVNEFPGGYIVWNVGEDYAPAGMVPLCKLLPPDKQPFDGGRMIDENTLKALPVSNEIRRVTMRKAAKREIDRDDFEVIKQIVELSLQSHKTK